MQTGRRPHFPGVEKGAGDGLLPHGSVPPRTSELGVPAEHQEPCGARTAAGSSLLKEKVGMHKEIIKYKLFVHIFLGILLDSLGCQKCQHVRNAELKVIDFEN